MTISSENIPEHSVLQQSICVEERNIRGCWNPSKIPNMVVGALEL